MFGDNPKRPPIFEDKLYVKKIFSTIQCEGIYAGVPAIFVRLGGCNLACDFCDTDFENFTQMELNQVIFKICSLSEIDEVSKEKQSIKLVVITGGEPFRQEIGLLCKILLEKGFKVQVETNGTLYRNVPSEVFIVCSPKIGSYEFINLHPQIIPHINSFKFIISAIKTHYNDINIIEKFLTKIRHINKDFDVFLQPMDQQDLEINKKNIDLTIKFAKRTNYKISYQMHKIFGIE